MKNHSKVLKEYVTQNNKLWKRRNDTTNLWGKWVFKNAKSLLYMQRKLNTDKKVKNAFKLYCKVRDHCHYIEKYRGTAHNICNLRYKIPKEIIIVFHNGSTYNYHFIINELTEEYEGQFECLGENTNKYITFPVPI